MRMPTYKRGWTTSDGNKTIDGREVSVCIKREFIFILINTNDFITKFSLNITFLQEIHEMNYVRLIIACMFRG